MQSGGGGTRTTSSVQCGPQAEPARARLEGAIAKQASLGGGGSVQVPSLRSSLITFFRRGEMIAIKEKRGALRFCGARRGPAGLLVERSRLAGWHVRVAAACGGASQGRGQATLPRQKAGVTASARAPANTGTCAARPPRDVTHAVVPSSYGGVRGFRLSPQYRSSSGQSVCPASATSWST